MLYERSSRLFIRRVLTGAEFLKHLMGALEVATVVQHFSIEPIDSIVERQPPNQLRDKWQRVCRRVVLKAFHVFVRRAAHFITAVGRLET